MRYRLAVLVAALLFSTGGAVIKLTTLTSWEIAGLRSLAAAAVLFTLLPESRRIGLRAGPGSSDRPRDAADGDPEAPRRSPWWPGWTKAMEGFVHGQWGIWPAAVAYAATLVLFVLATKLTTSANAIFLQATAPLWLMLLGPYVLGERSRPRDRWLALAMAAGMACSLLDRSAATALAPQPALGNMLAAASGLSWAVTVMALRDASRREGGSSLPVVTAGNLLACGISLPFMLPLEPVDRHDLLAVLYLGVIQVGLAYVIMDRAMRHVPALETGMLVLLEPAMNPVWTFLLLGERPGPLTLVGGLVILATTLANVLVHPRDAATGPSPAPRGRSRSS